jgi:hypothetical protein
MTYIWTVEVDAYYPPGSSVLTGHYASGMGLITSATDTPAKVVYEPRLAQPALVQRDAFDNRTTMGKSRVGMAT